MDEEVLRRQREHLDKQIKMRLEDYSYWWLYNSKRRDWLFFANIGCSLVVVVAGLYQNATLAGIFGAILTCILALQKYYPLDQEATWYGVAVSRCKNSAK